MTSQLFAQRKPPPAFRIADFWRGSPELPEATFQYIGMGEPSCFKCGWLPPVFDTDGYGPIEPPDTFWSLSFNQRFRAVWARAAKFLDRAHLVDWSATHDDGLDNQVMLCHYPCHDRMPSFLVGEREKALDYIRNDARGADPRWQMMTDELGKRELLSSGKQLKEWYIRFLEIKDDDR